MPTTEVAPSVVVLRQAVAADAGVPVDRPATMSKVLSWAGFGLPASGATGGVPDVPPESPVLLAMLAWGRGKSQESLVADGSSTFTDAAPQPTLMTAATLTGNQAPTVGPQPTGIPDPVTGVVNGAVVASDGDGNTLTYSASATSANGGKVTINSTTGAYTYTPTTAARVAAGTTAGADTDTFTVSVSDGQANTTATVPVYVSPLQLNKGTPITVGNQPDGIAVYESATDPSKNRAYVINQYDKTVSIIDTNPGSATYNKLVGTVKLASTPSDIVLNSTGTRAYVATKGNASVAVIDTASKTVLTNVKVGSTPVGIAISPDDKRVYVANGGSGTVSVINTTTNKLVDINPSTTTVDSIKVGSQPSGVAVSPDGSKLYVTLRYSDSLAVVNLATPTANPTLIKVGDSPRDVALNSDGSRAFVTNYDGTVSVVNTTTKQVTTIATGGPTLQPAGVAIDNVGGLVYVANGKDTVSVIDAKTNTIIRTLTIDAAPENGQHWIALSPDGKHLYITDINDDNVRTLSLTRGNTAPVAIANPTVGSPNPSTGAVTGLVNIKDPDGDPLTFTTASGATQGTVSYNTATGTYTYTPNSGAQNPGSTDTFTVRATDSAGAYKDATITVPFVSPPPPTLPVTTTVITVGDGPTKMAFSGSKAYVLNERSGTLTVIDTTTNQVVGQPIQVPGGIGVVAHDQTVYVADFTVSYDGQISVIDATQDKVVGGYYVGPCGADCWYSPANLEISNDGTRLSLVRDDGGIYTIDAASGSYLGFTETDCPLLDIGVSADGKSIYAPEGYSPTYRDTIGVYTGDYTTRQGINVGPNQFDQPLYITLSSDGTRAYSSVRVRVVEPASGPVDGETVTDRQGVTWKVTGSYYGVSVIDTDRTSPTYNKEIGFIRLSGGAQDLALSPDGTRLYVDQGDGRSVTVIDVATNTVVGSFTTDPNSSSSTNRYIQVGPDGTVYVTDYADDAVYATTVGSTAV
ncbi:beta-propeller fold lactonase family protein [Mycobacterium sp. OAE908]|uniref:beta-propeller fold lactonase family protein n=1 Tax=Mycobacterium sp. OAE908 TaxID=2817899 RepID=UPI001AEB4A3A